MGNDIAHRDEQALAASGPASSGGVIQSVLDLAKDPNIDAAKVATLANLAMTLQDRELKAQFQRDLNAAMMEMPVITKAGEIIIPANREKGTQERKQGKFARYEDIDRVCRPILRRHNLAIRFDIGGNPAGGGLSCVPILSHANGYEHRGQPIPAPIETSGSKNNLQGVGSTITYLKRYAYCSALNIVTEGIDDDGNLGRGLMVTIPFEREETVKAEARAAADEGRYSEWFSQQSPKDRAWLASSGLHHELGGQPALPTASARPQPEPEDAVVEPVVDDQPQAESTPQAEDPPPKTDTKSGRTPRQWVDAFKDDVVKCRTVGFLDEFMEGKRGPLDRLKGTDEPLWEETQQAYRDRKAAIEEGRLA